MAAKKSAGLKLPGRRLAEAGWAGGELVGVGAHGRPLCRWCRMEILAKRRRTFCSAYCVHQWRLRSDPGYLRDQVFLQVWGMRSVAATTPAGKKRPPGTPTRRSLWDADHVRPVAEGGGECDLDNLRTLCLCCHREVTADLRRRLKG